MTTLQIVCDSTELVAIFGAEVPDTLVIGGYALPDVDLSSLVAKTREIKLSHLGNPYVPIKWNIRDLNRALNMHNINELQPVISQKSDMLRSQLLAALSGANAILFLSILLAHSNKRQVIGRTKEDLIRYSFGNLLMRAGLYWKDAKVPVEAEVILDWPQSGRRQIFINEYFSGWKDGFSLAEGTEGEKVPYHCGALRDLRFRPSPLFGITDLDERLQLADLVVGAARSFVKFCMGEVTETDFGVQQFVSLAPRLYREGGWKCFGRGLTVSPANSPFSEMIFTGFDKLKC